MGLFKDFKRTFYSIRKNKLRFTALIFTQLILIILISYLTLIYANKVMTAMQEMVNPLENLNYENLDQISQDYSPPSDSSPALNQQMAKVKESYEIMKTNFLQFLKISALALIIFNFLLWNGSLYLIKGKNGWKKTVWSSLPKYLLVMLSFFAGIYYVVKYFFNRYLVPSISQLSPPKQLWTMLVIPVAIYFLSLIFISSTREESWKRFFSSSVRKIIQIHRALPAFLFCIILLIGSGYLIFAISKVESSRGLLILSPIIISLVLVFSRIFWITSCENILKRKTAKKDTDEKEKEEYITE